MEASGWRDREVRGEVLWVMVPDMQDTEYLPEGV